LTIVKYFDVFGDPPDGLLSHLLTTGMDKLILEPTPEALHGGIIVVVPEKVDLRNRRNCFCEKMAIDLGIPIKFEPINYKQKKALGSFLILNP
jgi:hypothetical protein